MNGGNNMWESIDDFWSDSMRDIKNGMIKDYEENKKIVVIGTNRFDIIDKNTLIFNEKLKEILCKEVHYNITLMNGSTISGVGCFVFGCGGNTSTIDIFVEDRDLHRISDIRLSEQDFKETIKRCVITVK